MKKESDSSCSTVFIIAGLALLAIATWKTVQFLQKPDAARIIGSTLLELLEAAGICLGAAVLFFGGFILFSLVFGGNSRNRVHQSGPVYSMRCYPTEMEKPAPVLGLLPANLPEAPGQASNQPVYLQAVLTNYGPGLAAHPAHPTWQWFPEDNAARFNQVSSNLPGQVILPMGYFSLYYIVCRPAGANLVIEMKPPEEAGYSGSLPAVQGGESIKIVIIYTALLQAKKPEQTIYREQPLRLKLVALDRDGRDDPAATRQFYTELEERMHSTGSNSDDDEWMYHSRPYMGW